MGDKTMRSAFIRVSADNNTAQGFIHYSYDDFKNMVFTWNKSKRFKYYIKDHNTEKDDPNPHYHAVLVFKDPTKFSDIKSHFPFGSIENPRKIKDTIQYLVHMNDLSKKQYDFSEIVSNDDNINKYRIQSYTNQMIKLDEYLHRINDGEIREYNLTTFIPIDVFSNYKSKILNALEYYRRRVMTDVNRNITVMIFTGATGTYKTTYAKQYCKNMNKSFCVSSSSNDPMQDYKGEDVLILDDIRDTTFKFHDFLKVLDNHTNSSVQSRYNNKAFIGDTIIITSSLPITEWYFDSVKEDKEQLYRRIPVWYQFSHNDIQVFQYSEKAHKYLFLMKVPNVNEFTPAQVKKSALDTLKVMGVSLSPEIEEEIKKREMNFEKWGDLPIDETSGKPVDFQQEELPF